MPESQRFTVQACMSNCPKRLRLGGARNQHRAADAGRCYRRGAQAIQSQQILEVIAQSMFGTRPRLSCGAWRRDSEVRTNLTDES